MLYNSLDFLLKSLLFDGVYKNFKIHTYIIEDFVPAGCNNLMYVCIIVIAVFR